MISATHQDLRGRVAAGQFRHDLYFRLVTFEINIPPLRQRGRRHRLCWPTIFSTAWLPHRSAPRPALSAEALAELQGRPWAGNVRQLRNAVEHAMILARGGTILPEHFPPPAQPDEPATTGPESELAALVRRWAELQLAQSPQADDLYNRLLKLVEPPLLQAALQQHGGQCATAARQLGLHRTTLRRKLDEIQRGDSGDTSPAKPN